MTLKLMAQCDNCPACEVVPDGLATPPTGWRIMVVDGALWHLCPACSPSRTWAEPQTPARLRAAVRTVLTLHPTANDREGAMWLHAERGISIHHETFRRYRRAVGIAPAAERKRSS